MLPHGKLSYEHFRLEMVPTFFRREEKFFSAWQFHHEAGNDAKKRSQKYLLPLDLMRLATVDSKSERSSIQNANFVRERSYSS